MGGWKKERRSGRIQNTSSFPAWYPLRCKNARLFLFFSFASGSVFFRDLRKKKEETGGKLWVRKTSHTSFVSLLMYVLLYGTELSCHIWEIERWIALLCGEEKLSASLCAFSEAPHSELKTPGVKFNLPPARLIDRWEKKRRAFLWLSFITRDLFFTCGTSVALRRDRVG